MEYCNLSHTSQDDIESVCEKIRRCARLVKICDAMLKDHRGKRHTSIGKNKATLWEIWAVIKIRTGLDTRNIKRTDYTSTITPDHSIIITDKKTGEQWVATASEIDNLERSVLGTSSLLNSGSYNASGINYSPKIGLGNIKMKEGFKNPFSQNKPVVSSSNNSNDTARYNKVLKNILEASGIIATIVFTLSKMNKDNEVEKAGDAVAATAKETTKQFSNLLDFLKKKAAAFREAIRRRQNASKSK